MKIAIVSDSLPGYHWTWSGAEIIALTLADMLKGGGCEIFFITPPLDRPSPDGGYEVCPVRTPLRRLGALSRNFPVDLQAIMDIRKVLKKKKPDIVHINAKYLFLPALIVCSRLGIRAVFTVPDYFIFCPTTFIRRPDGSGCASYHGKDCCKCLSVLGNGFLKKIIGSMPGVFMRSLLALRAKEFDYFLKKLSAYVVLSESSRKRLVDYGIPEEKIKLIYHYRLAALRDTEEAITNPSAVFAGWLSEENGIDVLVKAFIQVQKAVPDAKLYLVGTGKHDFVGRLKKETAKAGITDSVVFLGKKENREALSVISKCDVTVVPHQWPKEFGPVILIEALALGRPVIASRTGAADEFMADGENGFLIEDYRNPGAFAEKLERLLSDTGLAREMGGRVNGNIAFVKDDSSSKRIMDLYRTVMAEDARVG
ncbi:MAG: glycosyltransferase family 4 protein [Deltaproteobacteria bacterium]|nr:glycosyltransferase family 4 protein [Deltaproteobacteria bacterium]